MNVKSIFGFGLAALLLTSSAWARVVQISDVTDNEYEARKGFHIYQQLHPGLTEDVFLSRLKDAAVDGYRLFYAYEDDVIVGLVGFKIHTLLYRGRAVHIDSLVVDKDSRRNGLGKQLLAIAEVFGKADGASEAYLETGHKRAEANAFYPRVGYTTHAHSYRKLLN